MSNAWDAIPKEADWYVQDALRESSYMARGIAQGYAMGFKTFDHFFRLRDGQFIVLAGRPAMGKTSLALQIAYNMAQGLLDASDEAGRVLFFSAEMTGVELFHKLASQLSGVNLQEGYAGRWTPSDATHFDNTLKSLSTLPLHVNDLNVVRTEDMKDTLTNMKLAGMEPRALFFDYIELGADDDKHKENERVAQIAFRLKNIASLFKIPVIGLSQVNRAVENEANKMPLMINLAGSDSVARTADKVLAIMRPGYYLRNGMSAACEVESDKEGTCYVSIQKDRFGRSGQTFRLAVNEKTYQFSDFPSPGLPERAVRNLKSRKAEEFAY